MNCDQESVCNKQTINRGVPNQWLTTEQKKSNQNDRFTAWFSRYN